MNSVEKQEKFYEFYEFIANKVVDLKAYVQQLKNPEDRSAMETELLKMQDAIKDIRTAYDSIDELENSDDDDDDGGGDGYTSSYDGF